MSFLFVLEHTSTCGGQLIPDGITRPVVSSALHGLLDIFNILASFGFLFRPFGCIAPKTLNFLAFQSFDFERT